MWLDPYPEVGECSPAAQEIVQNKRLLEAESPARIHCRSHRDGALDRGDFIAIDCQDGHRLGTPSDPPVRAREAEGS